MVISSQDHTTALERCRIEHDLALRAVSSNALKRGQEEGKQQGLVAGVEFYRQQILATPIGQHFIQIMRDELVEAYLRTPAFMSHMCEAVYHFEGYAITATLRAAHQFLSATGELIDDQVTDILNRTHSFPDFQTDEFLPKDFACRLKPMQSATQAFVQEPLNSHVVLCLPHVPNPVVPYFSADLQIFASSHSSLENVRLRPAYHLIH